MARPLRIEFAGACYHVINRGNYRRNLFGEPGAAESFEIALGQAALRFRWRLHAYVVMRNHFHLALELTEPNLSEGTAKRGQCLTIDKLTAPPPHVAWLALFASNSLARVTT
jgi:REP element-mobilizing transposase RayT